MQQKEIEKLKKIAIENLGTTHDDAELEHWRIRFLGRKGEISSLLRNLSSVAESDRASVGASANELKLRLQQEYEIKMMKRCKIITHRTSNI